MRTVASRSPLPPFALDPERASGIRAGRNCELHRAVKCGHAHLGAKCRLVERNRQIETQVVAIRLEQGMRRDIHGYERIARPSVRAWPTLTFQPDLLTARNPRRNLDLDVFPGRQMDAGLCPLGCIIERNSERGMQILPRAGACTEILAPERRAGPMPRTATRGTAKHPAQKFVDSATTTAA